MKNIGRFLAAAVFLLSIGRTEAQNNDLLAVWGTWRNWSECTRSCGGGIEKQQRFCFQNGNVTTNDACDGEHVKYNVCNIQDCPVNSIDFRMLQCSAYNNKTYKEKLYKWASFYHSAGECELKCMPKDNFFYVMFSNKVIDGTRCNENSLDVCVNGTCLPVGCDMQLYSKARFDNCRVCNGGDRSCKKISQTFKLSQDAYDYVDITTIPAGATNIKVKELGPATNYIAMSSSGKNVLNGVYTLSNPGSSRYDGSTMKYDRKANGINQVNQVVIDGPTKSTLSLQILVVGRTHHNISYEYYVPNDFKGIVDKVPAYEWIAGDWSDCTKTCATGKRTRNVYCSNKETKEKVKTFYCNKNEILPTEEQCNRQACPARWYISQWSECSRTCGEGFHTRRVHCIETIEGSNINMLDFLKCPGLTPHKIESCVREKKCPEWIVEDWSTCSETCGEGYQTRGVTCVDMSSENSVEESKCLLEAKPLHERKCYNAPCGAQWETEEWSKCSSHCGDGLRSRRVSCRTSKGYEVPNEYCNPKDEPKHYEKCTAEGPCKPMWHATEWSNCTAKCGYGMQMRIVVCAEKSGNDQLRIVKSQLCNDKKKLSNTQKCVNHKPCYAKYYVSKWKQCSTTCGTGIQQRSVNCYADRRIDHSEKVCKHLTKPLSVKLCKNVPCKTDNLQPITKAPTTTIRPTMTVISPSTTQPRPFSANIVSFSGPELLHKGDNADYQCLVAGLPKPSVTWTLAGKPITSSRFHMLNIKDGSRLLILAASSTDIGELRCIARNRYGSNFAKLTLKVLGPPVVNIEPETAHKFENDDMVLNCKTEGSPLPRIQWTKEGYTFYGDNDRVIVHKHRIIFKKLIIGDSGQYRCLAFNSAGTSSIAMSLTVVRKPSAQRTDCFDDNTRADCQLIASIRSLCSIAYYKDICCQACTGRD